MAAKPSGNKSVLLIGLGRFGGSVAATLDQMGQDVLAVDKNPELVARWSAHLPTIQADMTDVLASSRSTPPSSTRPSWPSATASRLR